MVYFLPAILFILWNLILNLVSGGLTSQLLHKTHNRITRLKKIAAFKLLLDNCEKEVAEKSWDDINEILAKQCDDLEDVLKKRVISFSNWMITQGLDVKKLNEFYEEKGFWEIQGTFIGWLHSFIVPSLITRFERLAVSYNPETSMDEVTRKATLDESDRLLIRIKRLEISFSLAARDRIEEVAAPILTYCKEKLNSAENMIVEYMKSGSKVEIISKWGLVIIIFSLGFYPLLKLCVNMITDMFVEILKRFFYAFTGNPVYGNAYCKISVNALPNSPEYLRWVECMKTTN